MPKNIYLIDSEIKEFKYFLPEVAEITLGRQGLIKIPCRVEKSVLVSRIHCRLLRKDLEGEISGYSLAVIDGESNGRPSKNGTYVNGERISNEEETPLENNSLLSLKKYELKVIIENSA